MNAEATVPDAVIPAKAGTHFDVLPSRHSREGGNPVPFARYPKYRDSGIAWLGEVPAHWQIRRISTLFSTIASGTTPSSDDPDNYDGDVCWVTTGELREQIIDDTEKKITYRALEKFSALNLFPKGTLLIALYGATIGRLGILGTEACTNQACCGMANPADGVSERFVFFGLLSARAQLETLASGGGQPNISQEKVRSLRLATPSFSEQKGIVTFLDRETAKIEALISEQEKLIALLKEKRQALISHAVTKGLDPNAPMKDSGIEWLGQVPAHWKVRAIKHIVATPVTDGPHETPEFLDEGVPFVSAEAVSDGNLNFEKIRGYISREAHERYALKYRPRKGDIYMVKSGATTGVTAIVTTDDEFNIWSPLAAIRCDSEIHPGYLLHYVRSRNFLDAITLGWSFGTQQNIGMNVIENLAVLVPPTSEQDEIQVALDNAEALSESLVAEAARAITLLKERRAALISAAVTGKIDVRGAGMQ